MFGENLLCQKWFGKFQSGHFDVKNASQSGKPIETNEDKTKALID